jgi:hypothetical protein
MTEIGDFMTEIGDFMTENLRFWFWTVAGDNIFFTREGSSKGLLFTLLLLLLLLLLFLFLLG